MEILDNSKKYLKHKPEYQGWKEQQDLREAKRLEYLKQNPDKISQSDIERGKKILYAVDVMDEYSQKNAEDMEIATDMAVSQAMSISSYVGMGLGAASLLLPPVKNSMEALAKKFPKIGQATYAIPAGIGILASISSMIPLSAWAANMQVGASRNGRLEAMQNDLKKPNVFAELTDEQITEAKESAKNIKDDEKEAANRFVDDNMFLGPIKTLIGLFTKDEEYVKLREEFEKTLDNDKKSFEKPLSPNDVKNAKRDQQMLASIVQKIDIESQDYAENVEYMTNILNVALMGSGGLLAMGANALVKRFDLIKSNNTFVKLLPSIAAFLIPTVFAAAATKIQKQASRVGRFMVKQELVKNPENLVYVDDKALETIGDVKPKQEKKPGYFAFLHQIYKENKIYNEYMKTTGVENKKFNKAVQNLELTEKQTKDAQTLQKNVFKTFNETDEKSQQYSESIEALGEMVKGPVANILALTSMGIVMLSGAKRMMKMDEETFDITGEALRHMGKTLLAVTSAIIPVIIIDYFVTKEQKMASRVANMLAIKDLEDHRNYVDYNNLEQNPAVSAPESAPKSKDFFSGFSKSV